MPGKNSLLPRKIVLNPHAVGSPKQKREFHLKIDFPNGYNFSNLAQRPATQVYFAHQPENAPYALSIIFTQIRLISFPTGRQAKRAA